LPQLVPRIEELSIRNLLSFGKDGAVIPLGRLNVLIGPNGSGKSNVLDVLRLLQAAPTDFAAPMRASGGVEEWINKSAPSDGVAKVKLHLRLSPRDEDFVYYDILFQAVNGRTAILQEGIGRKPGYPGLDLVPPGIQVSESSLPESRWSPDPVLRNMARRFEELALYTDWSIGRTAGPRSPQSPDQDASRLFDDASNLALVLSQLQGTEAYDRIVSRLKDLKEDYAGYYTSPVGGPIQLFLREKGLKSGVPAPRLSDGTLRFLSLCAALLHPTPPWFIAMEEPDVGMHPDLIRAVADMLAEASQKSQVLVTTHSADLLTTLGGRVDNILVFEAGEDGTEVKRYTADQIGDWLKKYRLGDLWKEGDLGGNRY